MYGGGGGAERRQETKPRLVPALLKETNMAGRGRGRGRGLLTAAKPPAPGGGNDIEAKVENHLHFDTSVVLVGHYFRLCDGLFLFRHDSSLLFSFMCLIRLQIIDL